MAEFETITYEEDGPVGTITLNRPDDGNMFTPTMCEEVTDCLQQIRRETRTRVIVLTGAGDRFFASVGARKNWKTPRYTRVCCRPWTCTQASIACKSRLSPL